MSRISFLLRRPLLLIGIFLIALIACATFLFGRGSDSNVRIYPDFEGDSAIIPGMVTWWDGHVWNGFGYFRCNGAFIGDYQTYYINVVSVDTQKKVAVFEDSRGETRTVLEGGTLAFTSPCNGEPEIIATIVTIADYGDDGDSTKIVNLDLAESYLTRSFDGSGSLFNTDLVSRLKIWWGQYRQHQGE